MQEAKDCLFCQIIKEGNDLIYQDENTAAFLDIKPVEKAHILVVPKTHSNTWIETSEENIKFTNVTAQKLAKKLLNIFPNTIKGFNIITNNGKEASQTVFHFHIHVIPKFEANKGFQIKQQISESEVISLSKTRKLLQKSFKL